MDSFGNQYPEEEHIGLGVRSSEVSIPSSAIQNMTYYLLWASVANKGSRDLLNANYVLLLLFFFLRCGLKCKKRQEIMKK